MIASLMAHESGFTWDEALLVVAPLVVVGALLGLARARVRRQAAQAAGQADQAAGQADQAAGQAARGANDDARSAAHDVGTE
jgi:hypothetical protein